MIEWNPRQASSHPIPAQSRHVSCILLKRSVTQSIWYVMINCESKLAQPLLAVTQSQAKHLGHASHHTEYHSVVVLIKRHRYHVSTVIL